MTAEDIAEHIRQCVDRCLRLADDTTLDPFDRANMQQGAIAEAAAAIVRGAQPVWPGEHLSGAHHDA